MYLFILKWTLNLFLTFGYCEQFKMSTCIQAPTWIFVFSFSWIHRNEIVGSHGNFIVIWRVMTYFPTAFHQQNRKGLPFVLVVYSFKCLSCILLRAWFAFPCLLMTLSIFMCTFSTICLQSEEFLFKFFDLLFCFILRSHMGHPGATSGSVPTCSGLPAHF